MLHAHSTVVLLRLTLNQERATTAAGARDDLLATVEDTCTAIFLGGYARPARRAVTFP